MLDRLPTTRWRTAVTHAARQTLADRWRSTLELLLASHAEYRRLRTTEPTDVRALRKAAQRLHDLEQLRNVLTGELQDLSG